MAKINIMRTKSSMAIYSYGKPSTIVSLFMVKSNNIACNLDAHHYT